MSDDVVDLSFDRTPATYEAQVKPQWKSSRGEGWRSSTSRLFHPREPHPSPGRGRDHGRTPWAMRDRFDINIWILIINSFKISRRIFVRFYSNWFSFQSCSIFFFFFGKGGEMLEEYSQHKKKEPGHETGPQSLIIKNSSQIAFINNFSFLIQSSLKERHKSLTLFYCLIKEE